MSHYDEVEIEDMTWDESRQMFHYPCPCGDQFEVYLADLLDIEDPEEDAEAHCPSCSLWIKVIFDKDNLPTLSTAS